MPRRHSLVEVSPPTLAKVSQAFPPSGGAEEQIEGNTDTNHPRQSVALVRTKKADTGYQSGDSSMQDHHDGCISLGMGAPRW